VTSGRRSLRQQLLLRPNLGGCALALLFWWRSLTPSMLPRGWLAQSLVSAASVLVGYGIGTLVGWLVHLVLARLQRQPGRAVRMWVWSVFGVLAAIVVAWGGIVWPRWQDDHLALLELPDLDDRQVIPMLLLTIVLVVVGLAVARVVWWAIRALDARLSRVVPRAIAVGATAVIVLVAAFVLVTQVTLNRFHSWANSAWSAIEDDTDEGTLQPASELVSGSPASLVTWDKLGREGRNFVAGVTTEDELRGFRGPQAEVAQPVRVYVGLRSSDDASERAALAVRELERTNAFDRKVLVVATPSGTGWVDPLAAQAIEQLYGGDTAIVATQYSFLPSWISTLVDGDAAKHSGTALFDAVERRWATLPATSRPKLLVFGQSLGSLGAEAAFTGSDARSSVEALGDRTDGALFTGPTNDNVLWRQLVGGRDDGSPVWRPLYDGGRTVRFANSPSDVHERDPAWEAPRVLYVQHASDPVTFWSMSTMWSKPDWLDHPRGSDIPARASWFPFVTWAQGLGDLAAGFSTDPGHGHDYSDVFVAGWAAVAPPDDWTDGDTRRLEAYLRSEAD
jgi:uncharacterized membrane protein